MLTKKRKDTQNQKLLFRQSKRKTQEKLDFEEGAEIPTESKVIFPAKLNEMDVEKTTKKPTESKVDFPTIKKKRKIKKIGC